MTDAKVVEIAAGALLVAAKVLGPILAVTLVVGVGIAIVQTMTQVQEATLTFVPKIVAVALVVLVGGSWMIRAIVGWVQQLWTTIPSVG